MDDNTHDTHATAAAGTDGTDGSSSDADFEALARSAAAELRRPAPAGGPAAARAARHRQQRTRALLAGTGVVATLAIALGVGTLMRDGSGPAVIDVTETDVTETDVTGTDDGSAPVTAAPAGAGPVERLLSQVPMPDSTATLQFYDLERVAALAGVDAPDPGDAVAVEEWIVALIGVAGQSIAAPGAVVDGWFADQDELEAEVGWSLVDIDRGMDLFRVSGERFSLYETELDPAEVEAVAGAPVDGVYRIGSGPDGTPNIEERSSIRLTGMPINIVVADGVLAVADQRADLERWASGQADSIGDDATLVRMARLLDEAGVLVASLRGPLDGAGAAGTYTASGVVNDGEIATFLWLADYADPATAEAAATAQLAAIEAAGVTGAESEIDGTFVTIRLEVPAGDLQATERAIRRGEPVAG